MAQGICIYVEALNNQVNPIFAELLTVAKELKATTGEPISALVLGQQTEAIQAELEKYGLDHIYLAQVDRDPLLQDDAGSELVAEILRRIEPSTVLIPASPVGRSLFSRVAIKLNCGMTADCTGFEVAKREDGSFYIKQNKPSYGDNVYVSIVMKEGYLPQLMTMRPGVFEPAAYADGQAEITRFNDLKLGPSGVEVLEVQHKEAVTDSISSAECVVVCGKGMEAEENFALVQEFADRIGAALACTRPLSDIGLLPFERQIGQTGFTIRPKLCISIGVSGAIQHTEGIKDVERYIAINRDPNAAIFLDADYGIVKDAQEVLTEFLKQE